MELLLTRLEQAGVIIADGAMGTMLFQRGVSPGECPEKINLEKPEVLEEIAGLYMNAGAEILQTNTFGGSPLNLARYGLDDQTEEINALAVRAVRKVAGDKVYITASCGPSGRILEPHGDTPEALVFDSFVRQLKALIAEGVDMISVETMSDLTEATLAVRAAKSISSSLPVCATMTFDATPRGFYTMMGTSIEQAAKGLSEAGADIIGSNCGNGIVKMVKVAEEFAKYSAKPIIIRSNAGTPQLMNGASVFPESPEFMADHCTELLKAGVKIIGGCCGTTPQHIAAFKEACRGEADKKSDGERGR